MIVSNTNNLLHSLGSLQFFKLLFSLNIILFNYHSNYKVNRTKVVIGLILQN